MSYEIAFVFVSGFGALVSLASCIIFFIKRAKVSKQSKEVSINTSDIKHEIKIEKLDNIAFKEAKLEVFAFEDKHPEYSEVIKVVGVGGGGGNALNRMIERNLRGVEFIAVNTDARVLRNNKALHKVLIGRKLTRGLGAEACPEIGRAAAQEDEDSLEKAMEGADMVFITCALGGGTGTGASPIIADIAKSQGSLVFGVVTKPFEFEGEKRMCQALEGLSELKGRLDTLIVIPNEKLFSVVDENSSFMEAFRMADDVLVRAVRGISDLITVPGLINVDSADVRMVMADGGGAIMGTGQASGENRAALAAKEAITGPLLEGYNISGAKGLLINITGGPGMTLHEVQEATSIITAEVHEEANIICGAAIKEGQTDFSVTVIATGFPHWISTTPSSSPAPSAP